jgi:signal transduction histidine kinase
MIDRQFGPITDAQRSTLCSIQKSGVQLGRLIGDLLDLSKLEESRLQLCIAEHELVEYARGLVAQAAPLAERKGITLTFTSDVTNCQVHCDLERIERVLVNLLSNAVKFTPPKGSVDVRLHDETTTVLLEVADTGIGFPSGMSEPSFSVSSRSTWPTRAGTVERASAWRSPRNS